MRTQGKKFTINVQHLEVYNSAVPHNRITVARIDHPQSVNPEATGDYYFIFIHAAILKCNSHCYVF